MRTCSFAILMIFLCVLNICHADPAVPSGFVINKMMDRIDGQIPRLEAIRNSEYGSGVIVANVNNGILTVLKVTPFSVELIGTKSGFSIPSNIKEIRFDKTGDFEFKLYVTVGRNAYQGIEGKAADSTEVLLVDNYSITSVAEIGSSLDKIALFFDFSDGTNGTSLCFMDTNFTLNMLVRNCLPSGRTDMDVWGMEFDPTGRYGYYLTMVDSDYDDDVKSAVYQLKPNYTWTRLTPLVSTGERFYKDISFSSGGSFGQQLYVSERITNSVMTVDPNGNHAVFSSGFNQITSITVDETGDFMYISDYDGIWQIRAGTTEPGPQLIMQEPKVPYDDVFTGDSGVSSVRFLWNENIQFTNNDIEVLNQNEDIVPSSVSGSGSQFLIIAFGETLLDDIYTITIKDTVTSVETGNSIDGDEDGHAGGDAIVIMEHKERHDSDNDNDVDMNDLAELAEKWLWAV